MIATKSLKNSISSCLFFFYRLQACELLDLLEMSPDQQHQFWRSLAAILQLSRIEFALTSPPVDKKKSKETPSSALTLASLDPLEKAEKLMGVKEGQLVSFFKEICAVSMSPILTGGAPKANPDPIGRAEILRKQLVCQLYDRVFSALLEHVNNVLKVRNIIKSYLYCLFTFVM